MSIYNEFRHITTNTEALAILDALERGTIADVRERRRAADKVWKLVAPACPTGHKYMVGTFWARASTRFVWWGLFGRKEKDHTEWLADERLRMIDTSKVFFQPVWHQPQPTARKY